MKSVRVVHPFFEAVKLLTKTGALSKIPALNKANKSPNPLKSAHRFLHTLKHAHPFIFDRNVTLEKQHEARDPIQFDNLAEDFSLPFQTSLYLLNGAMTIVSPLNEARHMHVQRTQLGFLIHENTVETMTVYSIWEMTFEGKTGPYLEEFTLNLKDIQANKWKEIDPSEAEFTGVQDMTWIMRLTQSISVKRIGVQKKAAPVNLKTKGMGAGYTVLKYDNYLHIADKEEYEYTQPDSDPQINWEPSGWRRGHWRAFYFDKSVTDQFGRRIVDYGRTGKDRAGNYCVPGYTWVVEAVLGDKTVAEIKARMVVHK
jgi:hypothetical protein